MGCSHLSVSISLKSFSTHISSHSSIVLNLLLFPVEQLNNTFATSWGPTHQDNRRIWIVYKSRVLDCNHSGRKNLRRDPAPWVSCKPCQKWWDKFSIYKKSWMFVNTRLPSGWTQISSHSSFVSKLFLFPPWRNPMQLNHPKQFLNSLLTVPPHQNLLQPPYSISKAHFTTKSLSGPRSLGIPQTWWTQWECSFTQIEHLRWCLRKLLVPTTHEIVSFCCAVSWKEKGSWSVLSLSNNLYHRDSIRRH